MTSQRPNARPQKAEKCKWSSLVGGDEGLSLPNCETNWFKAPSDSRSQLRFQQTSAEN